MRDPFHCRIFVTLEWSIYFNCSSVYWTPILISLFNIWPTQKESCSCPTLADFDGAAAASGFLSLKNTMLQRKSGSNTAFNSTLRDFHPAPLHPPPFSIAILLHLSSLGDGLFTFRLPLEKLLPSRKYKCIVMSCRAKVLLFLKVVYIAKYFMPRLNTLFCSIAVCAAQSNQCICKHSALCF